MLNTGHLFFGCASLINFLLSLPCIPCFFFFFPARNAGEICTPPTSFPLNTRPPPYSLTRSFVHCSVPHFPTQSLTFIPAPWLFSAPLYLFASLFLSFFLCHSLSPLANLPLSLVSFFSPLPHPCLSSSFFAFFAILSLVCLLSPLIWFAVIKCRWMLKAAWLKLHKG